jgi:DNA-binding LacI/PurR family transcriptional regulator
LPSKRENILPRRSGYRRAAQELGLDDAAVVSVTREQSADPTWFAEVVESGADVFLVEDHMLANNILQAGYTAGLRVNVDFAIAVLQAPFSDPYDGTFCAFLMEPKAEMGRHAARLLIELIEGREPAERQITLPCEPLLTITPTIRRPLAGPRGQ